MIDVSKQIYDYLLTQSAVTALVGSGSSTRIAPDRSTPQKLFRPEDGPAIVFEPRGGFAPGYDQQILDISYKFKFYGDSSLASDSQHKSAFDVYGAVHDALVDKIFGCVYWAGIEVTYQMYEEFALNWPYALAFFNFKVIDDGS